MELHRAADDAGRLAAALALARASGLPAVASGDVHMHARAPARAAGRADRDPPWLHASIRPAGGCIPNAERHLRSLAELRQLYPPALLDESVAIAERCSFSLSQLHYEYPPELVPAGLTAGEHLRALTEAGLRAPLAAAAFRPRSATPSSANWR